MQPGDAVMCYYGKKCKNKKCKFAHSLVMLAVMQSMKNTKMCRYKSECRSKHCPFAHSVEELVPFGV